MNSLLPVSIVLSFVMSTASAGDIAALAEDCNGCHGANGVSEWHDVPTIAGLPQFSHADALYLYRDRERPCEHSAYRQGDLTRAESNMCDVVADLDDDTIEALATHYTAFPFVAATQDFDPDLAAAGEAVHDKHCSRCHSAGGSDPDDEASILAGQWMGYLRASFEQYAAGTRWQDDKMREKMAQIDDDDIEALVHYYGSQQ